TSEDYKCIKFNKHTIFFTDDLNYQIIEINNYRVLVLGTLFDVKKPNSSVEEIITELLNYEFESDNYCNEMSFYNGRFIIFVEENNNLHLYPDATSLLSCYYHCTQNIVTSHSELLNLLLNYLYDINESKINSYGAGVLDFSKFQNIYKLNGNHKYSFEDNATT